MARRRLSHKYFVLFVTLVSGALLASGAQEIYFSYQESKAALVSVQREKAIGAATRIEQFVREIERQMGWTTSACCGRFRPSPRSASSTPGDANSFASPAWLWTWWAAARTSPMTPSSRRPARD